MTSSSARPDDLASRSSLPVARWKRALRALRKVLADPDQTDQVLEFLSVINGGSSTTDRIDRFFADPAGARSTISTARSTRGPIDLAALAALPAGTLGHAYATFLRSHGLTPDVFDGAPPGISDPRAVVRGAADAPDPRPVARRHRLRHRSGAARSRSRRSPSPRSARPVAQSSRSSARCAPCARSPASCAT